MRSTRLQHNIKHRNIFSILQSHWFVGLSVFIYSHIDNYCCNDTARAQIKVSMPILKSHVTFGLSYYPNAMNIQVTVGSLKSSDKSIQFGYISKGFLSEMSVVAVIDCLTVESFRWTELQIVSLCLRILCTPRYPRISIWIRAHDFKCNYRNATMAIILWWNSVKQTNRPTDWQTDRPTD